MKKTLLLLALFTVLVTGCVQKEIPADDVMADSSVIEEQLNNEVIIHENDYEDCEIEEE